MKKLLVLFLGISGLFLLTTGCQKKASPSFEGLNFEQPDEIFKPYPLWFWNNTQIDTNTLQEQIRQFTTRDGYGGFGIVPFGKNFKPEYLSSEYFQLYGKALSTARELGLEVSLYDEFGFPSGSAGAINGDGIRRFDEKYPGHTIKRLDKWEDFCDGPTFYEKEVPTDGWLMSAVAMDTNTLQRIDITGNFVDSILKWQAPAGVWRIMVFTCVKDGDPNVDYLNPESVQKFTNLVHDEYFTRFEEYFGTTIKTAFFDEPTMYRAKGRIWTPDFNEKFTGKYGFTPQLLYPALWYNIGNQTASARNFLFGFRAELYAKGFPGVIQEWCNSHHIAATGHQDNEEVINPVNTSGDLMKCFKYIEIPGIDKIGGDRPAERFYKIISSAAINWNNSLVMSETYGDMGNLSWDEMYHIAMEQYTKGINMMIPHAVWYDNRKVTFLPELSWRNPLYSEGLPGFNLFLSRLNLMLQNQARLVTDIAMIYPIHALQAENYLDGPLGYYKGGVEIPTADYVAISEILTNKTGHDFLYLHPEVLDEQCTIHPNFLRLNNEVQFGEFKVVIVPSMKTIALSNLLKIKEFYHSGGNVIFTTQLPVQSTGFDEDSVVKTLVGDMFGLQSYDNMSVLFSENVAGGKVFFLPTPDINSISEALDKSLNGFDVEFEKGKNLNYIHKVNAQTNVYYFANLHYEDISTTIKLRGKMVPEIRNPHTGHVEEANFSYEKNEGNVYTCVTVQIPSNRSLFVVGK